MKRVVIEAAGSKNIQDVYKDMSEKCAQILPECPFDLGTYKLFEDRFGHFMDLSGKKEISHEIPGEEVSRQTSILSGGFPEDTIRGMFGSGEFPIVNVYRDGGKLVYTINR